MTREDVIDLMQERIGPKSYRLWCKLRREAFDNPLSAVSRATFLAELSRCTVDFYEGTKQVPVRPRAYAFRGKGNAKLPNYVARVDWRWVVERHGDALQEVAAERAADLLLRIARGT